MGNIRKILESLNEDKRRPVDELLKGLFLADKIKIISAEPTKSRDAYSDVDYDIVFEINGNRFEGVLYDRGYSGISYANGDSYLNYITPRGLDGYYPKFIEYEYDKNDNTVYFSYVGSDKGKRKEVLDSYNNLVKLFGIKPDIVWGKDVYKDIDSYLEARFNPKPVQSSTFKEFMKSKGLSALLKPGDANFSGSFKLNDLTVRVSSGDPNTVIAELNDDDEDIEYLEFDDDGLIIDGTTHGTHEDLFAPWDNSELGDFLDNAIYIHSMDELEDFLTKLR